MMRRILGAAISTVALTACAATGAPPAEPSPPVPSDRADSRSAPEASEPSTASADPGLLGEWAKASSSGVGADPFSKDVVGFALGMDEAQVRQVCTQAKGEIMDTRPFRCTLDSVLREVFGSTALWLSAPPRGFKDGGISVEFDAGGHACGISVALSGRNASSVVPPRDLMGKLGRPLSVSDARDTRTARWQWPGEGYEAFVGWSQHLPSFEGSGGRRQWVSYCRRKNSDCTTFCSYVK
jgi:hypothetical protein